MIEHKVHASPAKDMLARADQLAWKWPKFLQTRWQWNQLLRR